MDTLTDRRVRGHGYARGGPRLLLGHPGAPQDGHLRLEDVLRHSSVRLHALGFARHRQEEVEVPMHQECDE